MQERNAFRRVILEANDDAVFRRALFIPVGWEDTLGGVGRPQGLINQDLRECDYFVLLLWDRWGTPSGREGESGYTSGTEEEFRMALQCFNDSTHPLRQLVVFFKAVSPDKLSDPGPQLQRVLEFKRELEASKGLLFHTFDEIDAFEALLRRHIAKWLRDHDHEECGQTELPPSTTRTLLASIDGVATPKASNSKASGELQEFLDDAERLADQGFLTDAEAIYARCITKYRDPDAFNRYGVFLLRSHRLQQAEVMFQQVEALAETSGEKWLSTALINRGLLARIKLDLASAESFYFRALEIDRKLGRERGIAAALWNLGAVAQSRGDLKLAKDYHLEALEVAERAQWLKGVATQHCHLGLLYLKEGDLVRAESTLSKALDCEQRLGRLEGVADACSGLGLVFQSLGELEKSEAMHKRALMLNEQLGRLAAVGDQYADLGIVYLKRGALAEAELALRKAMEVSERSGRDSAIANVHNCLGLVLKEKGDLAAAEKMHFTALRIYERLGLRDYQADQHSHLGSILEAKGRISDALDSWRTAAKLYKDVHQNSKAELLDCWAIALTGHGLTSTEAAS